MIPSSAILLLLFKKYDNEPLYGWDIYSLASDLGLPMNEVLFALRELDSKGLVTRPLDQTVSLTKFGLEEGAKLDMGFDEREKVLLQAIIDFEKEGTRPSFSQVSERTQLISRHAEFGLQSLLDGGLITGIDARTLDGFDYLDLRLLPPGRQIAEEWVSSSEGVVQTVGTIPLKIFISHSSRDVKVAETLIELLIQALHLKPTEIRCTSVDGYRLPVGSGTLETLRGEVCDSEVLIALMSEDSLKSSFVLFELGARWGAGKQLIPLCVGGLLPERLPKPIGDLNALNLDRSAEIHQLIADLAEYLKTPVASVAAYNRYIDKLITCKSAG